MDELREDIYRIHEHDNLDENCIDCEHFYRKMKKLGYSRRQEKPDAKQGLNKDRIKQILFQYGVRPPLQDMDFARNDEEKEIIIKKAEDKREIIANAICQEFTIPTADVSDLTKENEVLREQNLALNKDVSETILLLRRCKEVINDEFGSPEESCEHREPYKIQIEIDKLLSNHAKGGV